MKYSAHDKQREDFFGGRSDTLLNLRNMGVDSCRIKGKAEIERHYNIYGSNQEIRVP